MSPSGRFGRLVFPLWAGEVFCLVGETGSGKSTLAMIAAAVLEPDGGKTGFRRSGHGRMG
jgi:ABC-type glutathione transport system ATPase component